MVALLMVKVPVGFADTCKPKLRLLVVVIFKAAMVKPLQVIVWSVPAIISLLSNQQIH